MLYNLKNLVMDEFIREGSIKLYIQNFTPACLRIALILPC